MEEASKLASVSPQCPSEIDLSADAVDETLELEVEAAKEAKEDGNNTESREDPTNSETGTKPKKPKKPHRGSLKRKSDVRNEELSNFLAERKKKCESETGGIEHSKQAPQKEFQDQSIKLGRMQALNEDLIKMIEKYGNKDLQKQLKECLEKHECEELGKAGLEKFKQLCHGMFLQIQRIISLHKESEKEKHVFLEIIKFFAGLLKRGARQEERDTQSELHSFPSVKDQNLDELRSLLNELNIGKEEELNDRRNSLILGVYRKIKSVQAQLHYYKDEYHRVVETVDLLRAESEKDREIICKLVFGDEKCSVGL